jgi:anaerobic magnesium-protoporphyrin IX monomethyl ester cyclase
MKPDSNFQALLLQPPPGDVTGPYPALCYLKSFAARQGYRAMVKDLGIEALHYLSRPKHITAMLERIRKTCSQLEAASSLDVQRQQHYASLLAAQPAHDHPESFSQMIQLFRQPDDFYDYRRYKQARMGLNAFFDILSAAHYPTTLTAATYPTATMLMTMENIQAHQDQAVNPYIPYYEKVLFPFIAAHRPALVGISMVFSNQSVQTLVLGRMIKTRFPDIHVTLGGAYLSQWAMTADDARLNQLLNSADSIVCGEGEEAFTDLLERVLTNESPANLANLICRDEVTGNLLRCQHLSYTDISDQPPPDFSDLDLAAYLAPQIVIPYCISRGCYWGRCVFCQNRYGDHRMRRYQTVGVEKAISEMSALADQFGSSHFNFSNDVVDPVFLKKLSQAMLDSGRSFYWNTDLRAEKAYDAQTCQLMARAGLKSVAIGFESGCQKTLDAMDKGKQVETVAAVLQHLYTSGVATQTMGIFGMPGESEADGEETVRFLETNADHISYYVMGLLMVLPGSRMHSAPQDHGVTAISYERNPLNTPEPVWWSDTRMSIESVNKLYMRLNRLEEIFAIDEYPYVGGLGTNHGFLYYALGPDILKRLRKEEMTELAQLRRRLGLDSPSRHVKKLQKFIPRIVGLYSLYRSRFTLHRLSEEHGATPNAPEILAGDENDYLLLSGFDRQAPIPVGRLEIRLLNRIDGRRALSAVLKKMDSTHLNRALSFLWFLVENGVVVFSVKGQAK